MSKKRLYNSKHAMAMSSMALGGGILWKCFQTQNTRFFTFPNTKQIQIFFPEQKTIYSLELRTKTLPHYTSMGQGKNAGTFLTLDS